MSQENVELVRRMFERVGPHGERPEVFYEFLDVDAVWATSGLDVPGLGVVRGHDAVREWWRLWLGAWERWELPAERFIDAGDRVVVVVRQRARGKGSGVEVDEAHTQVWTLRDGIAIRVDLHADVETGLDSVGVQG